MEGYFEDGDGWAKNALVKVLQDGRPGPPVSVVEYLHYPGRGKR